jgi:AcrR family transcriptional regulator
MSLKDTIIYESIKLFSTKGYASCSITDILVAVNTSKGGFYNHFKSKEDLFHEVLAVSQRLWREKTLHDLDQIDSPMDTLIKFLENYRDRYLKDSITFPGGCIFITFSVELDNHRPELMQEVNKGFAGLKRMLRILLEQCKEKGELRQDVNTNRATEMIFSGMIGSSVLYGVDKSSVSLDRSINSLIDYLEELKQ